jgi:hypothetical protein
MCLVEAVKAAERRAEIADGRVRAQDDAGNVCEAQPGAAREARGVLAHVVEGACPL